MLEFHSISSFFHFKQDYERKGANKNIHKALIASLLKMMILVDHYIKKISFHKKNSSKIPNLNFLMRVELIVLDKNPLSDENLFFYARILRILSQFRQFE